MHNFFDPAILFFVFGILAGSLKSNLEIPPQISRFLSLYLLMALGLKGGFALERSGLTTDVIISLAAALTMALLVQAQQVHELLGLGVGVFQTTQPFPHGVPVTQAPPHTQSAALVYPKIRQ